MKLMSIMSIVYCYIYILFFMCSKTWLHEFEHLRTDEQSWHYYHNFLQIYLYDIVLLCKAGIITTIFVKKKGSRKKKVLAKKNPSCLIHPLDPLPSLNRSHLHPLDPPPPPPHRGHRQPRPNPPQAESIDR